MFHDLGSKIFFLQSSIIFIDHGFGIESKVIHLIKMQLLFALLQKLIVDLT